MEYSELSRQLREAGRGKDWNRVLEICQAIDEQFPENLDFWKQYWHARALIETGNVAQGLKMASVTFGQNPNFEANNNLIIYGLRKFADSYKPDRDGQNLDMAIELARRLNDKDTLADTIIRVSKKYHSGKDHELALTLMESLDFDEINTSKRQTIKGQVLSLAESYALELSWLYLKTQQPEKAEEIITRLYKKIERLDKNAEKFLRDRHANALITQGKYKEALEVLGPVIRFNEWIWYYRFAQVLKAMGEDDAALYYAVLSCLDKKQKPWFKNKVYLFLLRHLRNYFSEQEAKDIAQFLVRMYIDNGFAQSKTPQGLINFFGIKQEQIPDYRTALSKVNHILSTKLCREKKTGEITKLIKDFGFIRSKEGETFYFNKWQTESDWQSLRPGMKVSFCIGWNYDAKKKEVKKAGIKVKVL